MVNTTKILTKETENACLITSDQDYTEAYQKLKQDEAHLTEQKERLTNLLTMLETKAKEEIEKKQHKVQKLNHEVENLKRKCEKYQNLINSQITVECNTNGP